MAGRFGLEIRSATAADAQGLSELIGASGAAVSPRLLVDRIEAVGRGSGSVLLASEWGPPSGVVALSWSPGLEADAPTARITTLLVAAEARRRGLGRLLLKAAARSARTAGCAALRLDVPPGHPELEAFCRATGFAASATVFERALRKRG